MFKKTNLLICLLVLVSILFSCKTLPPQEKTIHELILEGKTEEVKSLFLSKGDVYEVDEEGNTPLHTAAKVNNRILVQLFLIEGANPFLKNNAGDTPLHVGIKNNSKESVECITKNKELTIFDRDAEDKSGLDLGLARGPEYYDGILGNTGKAIDPSNGRTIIHYIVEAENEEALDYCIRKGIDIKTDDNNGDSPLALAYARNSRKGIDIAAKLILANAKVLRKEYSYFEDSVKTRKPSLRFNEGQTPLHFAAIYGHKPVVSYLLENKASVNDKDILGSTPLHEAVRYGHPEIVSMLLENKADPNAQDSLGKTPLLLVIQNKEARLEIISLLITNGGNPNAKDMYGETPIHIATMSGMEVQILESLRNGGADINERNKKGITPMALAVAKLNKEHVEFFAKAGGDIHAVDNKDNTPLTRVIESPDKKTSVELLKILVNEQNITSRDSYGNTPLHIAIEKNVPVEQLNYLLSLTEDIDIRNRNGDTPLFIAVSNNKRIQGEMLLAKGADVFSTNNLNNSPLRIALENLGEVQEWLLTSEVIKKTDGVGNTPLHYAAEWNLENAVSVLLEKGSDSNKANHNGETPIFSAIKKDSPTIIDLLVAKGAYLSARDFLGNTPLHACVRTDAKNSALKLIQLDANLDEQNLAGKTPLAQAAYGGRLHMVKLLAENGANVNATDAIGRSVLVDAINSINYNIVNYLVNKGASPHIQDMYGRNAYHEAAHLKDIRIITMIREAGGNPLARDSNSTTPFSIVLGTQDKKLIKTVLGSDSNLLDSDSNTPLHIALENNASMDMLDFLISMDYPINTRNKEGITPLSIAVSKKLIGHTKTLLENGADPFVTDNTDECPISIILKEPNDKVREEILNNIIKIAGNKTDYQGEGILHYAAKFADRETVQYLTEKGLNKTARNISGETPYNVAVRWKNNKIADLLK